MEHLVSTNHGLLADSHGYARRFRMCGHLLGKVTSKLATVCKVCPIVIDVDTVPPP